jgi:hypothetical protein
MESSSMLGPGADRGLLSNRMEEALQRLSALGAEGLDHPAGDVLQHFRSTFERLQTWGEDEAVCWAGLYHAVYGTETFVPTLMTLERRQEVAGIIGAKAETHVYFFCACDRAFFARRLIREDIPSYRDRFSSTIFQPSFEQVQAFCAITLANEIDVSANDMEGYLERYGRYVLPIFRSQRFQSYLGSPARTDCKRVFG